MVSLISVKYEYSVKCKKIVQFKTIQFSVSKKFFVQTQFSEKTVLFLTTQFSISTKLNGSKYCYVSLTIHQSFVYTQIIDQAVLFLTIPFSISQQS